MARKPADQAVHRDDILHAAADVLRRKGYEAATMKDIAAAVNLTAASLYHHFRNKDTLLLAVLEAGLELVIARIEPIAAAADRTAESRLRAMICTHINALTENTAVGAAMVFEIQALRQAKPPSSRASASDRRARESFIARRDAFFARRDHFEGLFRSVIAEGCANGEFRPVDAAIAAKALLGAHNWVSVWYRADGRLSGAQIADQMADLLLCGLARAP